MHQVGGLGVALATDQEVAARQRVHIAALHHLGRLRDAGGRRASSSPPRQPGRVKAVTKGALSIVLGGPLGFDAGDVCASISAYQLWLLRVSFLVPATCPIFIVVSLVVWVVLSF